MIGLAVLGLAGRDIQFAEPLGLDRAVAALDLDGEAASAETVAGVKARGVRPLCYISVGTHEDWRADADSFTAEALGEEWPGERYLDIRHPGVPAGMRRRIADCAAKGFAGVDGDSQDLHGGQSGFPLTAADQIAYSRALAGVAHSAGLTWRQKNAPDLIAQMAGFADFPVTEDCAANGWCAEAAPYAAARKPVYAIEYTDRPNLDWPAACAGPRAQGLSMIRKDRALNGAVWEVC